MQISVSILIGLILAAILYFGGRDRIASFGGWLLGIGAGIILWKVGYPYLWVLEEILAAIDPSAVSFVSLLAFGILFLVMRWVAELGERALHKLIEWGYDRELVWKMQKVLEE